MLHTINERTEDRALLVVVFGQNQVSLFVLLASASTVIARS